MDMSLRIRIYTFLFGNLVGYDMLGNHYYQRKSNNNRAANNGRSERWVVYNGVIEASFIPPMWHSWLHHNTDDFPSDGLTKPNKKKIEAARSRVSKKYFPPGHMSLDKKRTQKKRNYQSWSPEA
ncbi:MAG: hypothetical protein CFH29_00400 [Alphaproteobacteria bacterium MarineAlpha7_Bin1]|jgi:NADH:ubiquinone oxidoreductase subunit|nr:MAG: hypothetical protein CFH29_00400 [Alphaproteobacteria bacterium MarineAlpha7_Bin1]